jgi:YidC/Oxa1 family membrane protein insertase
MNIGSQGILGLGVFQALRDMEAGSRFMWIADMARPDVILAFVVGVLTFFSMQMIPGLSEQQSQLMLLIPAMISMFVLVGFPMAIGLYWATSNVATIIQSLILRMIVLQENKSGGRP